MTAVALDTTLPIFTGLDGLPLSSGYVYVGVANQDPRTFPVAVFWDSALSISATQPLRTTAGYVVRSGAPAPAFIGSQFSLMVLDSTGSQVFYAPVCPGHALVDISTFMATVVGAASASAARVLLGLSSDGTTGFRNRLHNGDFRVNQRKVSGSVTLAAGAYGHDRWKAGAGGCTYTFAASGSGFIINISAGSLLQVVEDVNVEGGSYTLTNQGTSLARIAVNGAATSGSYAAATTAAPLASALATGGQAVSVEFSTGTIDRAQLEAGVSATAFERRPIGVETSLCQRHFVRYTGATFTKHGTGVIASATSGFCYMPFPVAMRSTPAFANGGSFSAVNATTVTALAVDAGGTTVMGGSIAATLTGGISGGVLQLQSNSSTSAYTEWSADL